jgi:Zn-dependent protease with chaperone function
MKFTPRELAENVNVSPGSPFKELFKLAAALLGLLAAAYLILGLAVDWAAPRLSPGFEEKLAAAFSSRLRTEAGHEASAQAVQGFLDELQGRCGRLPYRLKAHVESSRDANAMALPGGHIVVTRGLLETVGSENELVFILAHEMGHFAHRDHLRAAGRAMVMLMISGLLFGADSGINEVLGQVLNITELSFSRGHETAADEFGLKILACRYGHAAGAADFFRRIPTDKDPGRFGHYFSTHPENERRIAHIENIVQEQRVEVGPLVPLPDAIRALPTANQD